MGKIILHRKERLVLSAVEVIDELGYRGLTTREVARREGVTEATLFRHFKTKNELLLAVLEHYSQYDADIMASTKLRNMSPIDAITYFVNSYVEYYENYPAITAITQEFGTFSADPNLSGKTRGILATRIEHIKGLIEDAQRKGEIQSTVHSEKLADVIWGFCRYVCLKWRFNEYKFPLKEYALSTLDMILMAHRITKEGSVTV